MQNVQKQFVGVDCHKNTVACYVNGKFKEFKTDFRGFSKALEWAGKDCNWAIEGAYSYGLTFSEYLLNCGCKVYEFNSLSTAKMRKGFNVSGEKTDKIDAQVISVFANFTKIQEVSLKTVVMKRLLTQRKLYVKQRTEQINSLRATLMLRGIKPPFCGFTTKKAVSWLKNQKEISLQTAGNMLEIINKSITTLEEEIKEILPEKAKKLNELTGISDLTAATIYAETKGKKMTKAQFASYCGVAPVKVESGQTSRCRNNKRGNRILNSCLYSISMHQSLYDEIGAQYYLKKLQEGKTKRHARKCLSRQLCRIIWEILFSD